MGSRKQEAAGSVRATAVVLWHLLPYRPDKMAATTTAQYFVIGKCDGGRRGEAGGRRERRRPVRGERERERVRGRGGGGGGGGEGGREGGRETTLRKDWLGEGQAIGAGAPQGR